MGGSAFASLGLATPRMSPDTYLTLKKRYHDILATLYAHVTTPAEAPEKTSYGDIDFLVAEPLPLQKQKLDTVSRAKHGAAGDIVTAAFGAEYTISIGATRSYAVRIDETSGGNCGSDGKIYAQVDVHFCPSVENMRWMAFKHGYGDMWSILGMLARAKGLLADEVGLHLLIPEIEKRNKEVAKVELTRDVGETLAFFGLDEGVYCQGFDGMEGLFAFMRGCRFFEGRYFRRREWSTARDRKKVRKREMIRLWLEYVGVSVEQNDGDGEEVEAEYVNGVDEEEETVTREQVLEEALEKFGKSAVYEEKLRSWRRNEQIDKVVRRVVGELVKSGAGTKSARSKAAELRKQLQGGEMDEVLEMAEEQMQRFVDGQVEEFRKSRRSRRCVDASDVVLKNNGVDIDTDEAVEQMQQISL
ncbi:hypothetical protein TWF696_004248 [Orbilia brochopaga]|uniref:Uncharacterized protein n=1 Tax=Orbilia brochopaga TaxID=3140254 RepID=A0AAV9V6C1_9PEZI